MVGLAGVFAGPLDAVVEGGDLVEVLLHELQHAFPILSLDLDRPRLLALLH